MISFIIIGKDEGWRLKLCLDSICRVVQTDKIFNYEIIYIDSKSSDDSIATAESYQNVRVFLITGECNAAVARNVGAKESKGDILFFVDGDMEIQTGFLPLILTEKEELNYPFISGILIDVVYDNKWQFLYEKPRMQYKTDGGKYEKVVGGLFLITKELWQHIGGMDTRQIRSQDHDLGLRLSKNGVLLYRKTEILARHHMINYTLRSNYVTNVKYTALLLRKHWSNSSYIKIFLNQHYTTITLWLSMILCLATVWEGLLFYFFLVLYKGNKQRKNNHIGIVKLCSQIISRDILFAWYLVTFRQPVINELYKEIKK